MRQTLNINKLASEKGIITTDTDKNSEAHMRKF